MCRKFQSFNADVGGLILLETAHQLRGLLATAVVALHIWRKTVLPQ